LYTNVAYFDRDTDSDKDDDTDSDKDDWKLWSAGKDDNEENDERWTPGGSESDTNQPVFGRLTRYPEPIPLAHGIDETVSSMIQSGPWLIIRFTENGTGMGKLRSNAWL
jgi:hypothetical protein